MLNQKRGQSPLMLKSRAHDCTHSQYLPMTGSKLCPPVHFSNSGIALDAGELGSIPAFEMTRASQVMMWTRVSTSGARGHEEPKTSNSGSKLTVHLGWLVATSVSALVLLQSLGDDTPNDDAARFPKFFALAVGLLLGGFLSCQLQAPTSAKYSLHRARQ